MILGLMNLRAAITTVLLGFFASLPAATNVFEPEIRAFEARDLANPPPKQAVLFVGSSSIRLWKTLAQDFPEYRVINRGFGGSQIVDATHFAKRIVFPYEPRVIVMYSGGNDINAGKSAERVFADFQAFVSAVREKLPATHIAYISIAPNPARWSQVERIRRANELIRAYTTTDPRLSFIDAYAKMLGPDGQPRPDIFVADRLHMNEKGYAIWKQIVAEHLQKMSGDSPPR